MKASSTTRKHLSAFFGILSEILSGGNNPAPPPDDALRGGWGRVSGPWGAAGGRRPAAPCEGTLRGSVPGGIRHTIPPPPPGGGGNSVLGWTVPQKLRSVLRYMTKIHWFGCGDGDHKNGGGLPAPLLTTKTSFPGSVGEGGRRPRRSCDGAREGGGRKGCGGVGSKRGGASAGVDPRLAECRRGPVGLSEVVG